MLISFDIKGLEVLCAAYLFQDHVLLTEIKNKVNIHSVNQARFGFPNRLTAKRFKFKMIYGGTAFGFSTDADFLELKFSEKQWQKVIDEYYNKYAGIKEGHRNLIKKVLSEQHYTSPTGREYDFRELLKYKEWYYVPKIKNYPVQGLGADITMLARISLMNRMKKNKCKSLLVNTIHDSIVIDAPEAEINGKEGNFNIVTCVEEVFQDLPTNLNWSFHLDWDLPIEVEHKPLYGEMK